MATSKRKFYRTVFQYEVLSEEPITDSLSLEQINYECTEGDWSGHFLDTHSEELNGKAMADKLAEQGCDPEFFQLTENGEDSNA
jgi:hypothetical protein